MKRRLIFVGLALLIVASLVWTERARVAAPAGPGAILYFVADTEHELTRLPVAFKPMPDDEEIKIGDQLAQMYLGSKPREGTPAAARVRLIEGYVNQVGARVAAHARRKLPYRFHYLDRPTLVDAFALPGGHVFIGNGLLALMDSEDELAAVLGHEVEHIDHYHAAERIETERALRRIPLGGLAVIPIAVFEAGYSKDQELEADREGTRLAVSAGYSPLGALRLFETYERLYEEYITKAQTPQEELAQVAIQTLEGYFRTHPLPSERIAQIKEMITAENWGNLTSEQPLRVGYIFWTDRARKAEESCRYEYAVRTALYSLKLQPDQPAALDVLGRAQFMLADFDSAAATDRRLLNVRPTDVDLAGRYASALGARGNPQKAVQEFRDWLTGAGISETDVMTQMQADLAGLWLLAANPKPAAQIEQQLQAAVWAPHALGQLGLWYYRAGRYDQAARLLTSVVEQLPQDTTVRVQLGWTLLAQRKYESALGRFSRVEPATGLLSSSVTTPYPPGARMGAAIAKWESHQGDDALTDFASVIKDEPYWLNQRWVAALFAPGVPASIAQMRAELERRKPVRAVTSFRPFVLKPNGSGLVSKQPSTFQAFILDVLALPKV